MEILANAVLALHGVVVILLVLGIILAKRFPWYIPFHAALVTTTIVSQITFVSCPLTKLEFALRDEEIQGGFILNYLNKWFNLNPSAQSLTIATYLLVLYSAFLFFAWLLQKKHTNKTNKALQ